MRTLAAQFVIAAVISLILTPICRAVAQRRGLVAKPSRDRWHTRTTALLGGVAIVLSVLALGLSTGPDRTLWQLMLCGALIAAFGCVDDLLSLKASTKLIAQITVASLLLFFGFRLQWTTSLVGDTMLTLAWIVGIFLLMVFVSGPGDPSPPALYLAALLGATAGFLVYNFHPASIFMGDTGSLFLGLNVAALTLVANPATSGRSSLLSVVAGPVLPLLIPIFDTTFVTALRLLSSRKPSQGGRDHMSHRLVAVGLSERRAVATLWALAVAGGVISMLIHQRQGGWGIIAG